MPTRPSAPSEPWGISLAIRDRRFSGGPPLLARNRMRSHSAPASRAGQVSVLDALAVMYVIAGYTVDLSALLVRHHDDGDHYDDRNDQPNKPEQRVLPPSEIRRPGLPRHERIIAPARRLSSADRRISRPRTGLAIIGCAHVLGAASISLNTAVRLVPRCPGSDFPKRRVRSSSAIGPRLPIDSPVGRRPFLRRRCEGLLRPCSFQDRSHGIARSHRRADIRWPPLGLSGCPDRRKGNLWL